MIYKPLKYEDENEIYLKKKKKKKEEKVEM